MSTNVINVSYLKRYRNLDDMNGMQTKRMLRHRHLRHYNSDVMLDPRMFRLVCGKLGFYPDIDMYASTRHHQLSRYCSLQIDGNSYCRNCYMLDWYEYIPYVNPPWEEIGNALTKIRHDQANCLVVVPLWKRAMWFKLLRRLTYKFWITNRPLYLDENHMLRPRPNWDTCFALVDGSR